MPPGIPLVLGSLLWVWQAVDYAREKNWAMCTVAICYGLANAALAIDFIYRARHH